MEGPVRSSLSDSELLIAYKQQKKDNTLRAFLIGLFGGIALFSFYFKGIQFWTFFPLFFIALLVKKRKDGEGLKEEIKKRGLLS